MKAKLIDQLPAAVAVRPISKEAVATVHRSASDSMGTTAPPIAPEAQRQRVLSFAETLFLWALSRR